MTPFRIRIKDGVNDASAALTVSAGEVSDELHETVRTKDHESRAKLGECVRNIDAALADVLSEDKLLKALNAADEVLNPATGSAKFAATAKVADPKYAHWWQAETVLQRLCLLLNLQGVLIPMFGIWGFGTLCKQLWREERKVEARKAQSK